MKKMQECLHVRRNECECQENDAETIQKGLRMWENSQNIPIQLHGKTT